MRVEITQEHIDKAIQLRSQKEDGYRTCESCIIAQAVMSKGLTNVQVGFGMMNGMRGSEPVAYSLGLAAQKITLKHPDRWNEIEPQTIEVRKA